MGSITQYRQLLEQKKGAKDLLIKNISSKETEILKLKRRLRNLDDALPLVQVVAQQTQQELQYRICELVTMALAAVFPEPYEFNIDFVIKRGKTEAEISFTRDGNKIDPMEGSGYGPVDVAAFALRIGLWNLQRPKSRNTIILDEPGKFISEDLQYKFAEMIKLVSDKLEIQFIIITHKPQLSEVADKVFKIQRINKKSVITEK